ncbi:MAG: hypothetical protein AB1898_27100 [Acidobacteriota bacterium]
MKHFGEMGAVLRAMEQNVLERWLIRSGNNVGGVTFLAVRSQ